MFSRKKNPTHRLCTITFKSPLGFQASYSPVVHPADLRQARTHTHLSGQVSADDLAKRSPDRTILALCPRQSRSLSGTGTCPTGR